MEALNAEASAVRAAHQEADAALRAARALVRELGVLPSPSAGELPSLHSLREAEAMWLKARSLDSPTALADHLEAHVLDLSEAVARVVAEATEELSRREDVWRPLGQALALWLPHAEQFAATKEHVDQLKEAEDWWKDATEDIRNERFQPIADRGPWPSGSSCGCRATWTWAAWTLEGTATKRRVALKVTVDGKDAEALGVMSQGELHSLALSLFLPRATLPDSPFRFICVDDPVQSMDPARVEALARVLADTAKTRQVVVFTHDDRLPEAVRRLALPARILKVTRRADSVVEIGESRDPVSGYLDDARALLKSDELPAERPGARGARPLSSRARSRVHDGRAQSAPARRSPPSGGGGAARRPHQALCADGAGHLRRRGEGRRRCCRGSTRWTRARPPPSRPATPARTRRSTATWRTWCATPASWPTPCCGWGRNDAVVLDRAGCSTTAAATGTRLRARCWPPWISSWTTPPQARPDAGRAPRRCSRVRRWRRRSASTGPSWRPAWRSCDFRAQFLCLGRYLGDEPLAQRAHVVWSGLSSACHHHVYDLAPTREELQAWRETVQQVVERTERAWRA